jgi:hypothetical protein
VIYALNKSTGRRTCFVLHFLPAVTVERFRNAENLKMVRGIRNKRNLLR